MLTFKNDKELNITLKNLSFELLNLIASSDDFFNLISKEKYYMYVDYDKIKFDKYTFLITRNNKKAVDMIFLTEG
jgi:hypothetical protein